MIRIILGVILLIGLMYFFSWLGKASPADRSKALRLVVLYGAVGALLLLVVTGRLPWLFALAGVAVPWIQRAIMAKQAYNYFKSSRGPTRGQQSRVNTDYLNMTLDHDSGEMDGEVLKGRFAGRILNDLDQPALLDLMNELAAADSQSAQLLAAYLDRRFGDEWRQGDSDYAGADESPGSANLTRREALDILGLDDNAGRDEIVQAHRSLIQKMHPDRGGSAYLAAKINQAKDLLLDRANS